MYNFPTYRTYKFDRLEQSPADSFAFSVEHQPNPSLSYDNTSLNQYYDSLIGDEFTSGKTSEARLFPVNNRGNPARMSEKFFRVAVGNGRYYSQNNPMQSIQVVQGRYVCPLKDMSKSRAGDGGFASNIARMEAELGKSIPCGVDYDSMSMEQLADHIADYVFDTTMERLDVSKLDAEFAALYNEFIQSTRAKNYAEKFAAQINTNPKVVNFHLKTIFKAKLDFLSKKHIRQVGQGVSAWSALAQNYFALAGKIMNYAFFKCLRPNVIYDNRMTPEELICKTTRLDTTLSSFARNVVTDYTEYDKKQNRFTQRIEKRLWSRMGFSEHALDLYYSFRTDYLIVSKFLTAKVRSAKTSGEPLTLVNNTILNLALTHFLTIGDGPFYIVVKGDDGWKKQLNLTIAHDRVAAVKKFVDMDMKIFFGDAIEFCGALVTPAGMVPNLQRKLYKLLGHNFRSYEHFCEYQISLRDFVRVVNTLGVKQVVGANSGFSGAGYEATMNILYTLQSFAHIDKDQFDSVFREYEVQYGYYTKRGMNI